MIYTAERTSALLYSHYDVRQGLKRTELPIGTEVYRTEEEARAKADKQADRTGFSYSVFGLEGDWDALQIGHVGNNRFILLNPAKIAQLK